MTNRYNNLSKHVWQPFLKQPLSQRLRLLTSSLLLLACTAYATPSTRQASEPELRELLMKTVVDADSFTDRFDAQVWLLDMSTRLEPIIKDPQERLELVRLVHQEATRAGLRPDLVMAVIHTESRFNRFAVSSVGAQGIMQVMPFWKAELGRPQDNLTDIATNLRYGCTILSHYLKRENGNLPRALARYNGSLGQTWYSNRVHDHWHSRWYVRP